MRKHTLQRVINFISHSGNFAHNRAVLLVQREPPVAFESVRFVGALIGHFDTMQVPSRHHTRVVVLYAKFSGSAHIRQRHLECVLLAPFVGVTLGGQGGRWGTPPSSVQGY